MVTLSLDLAFFTFSDREWYRGFLRRHSDISMGTAQQLGHERAGINAGMIQSWFDGVINFLNSEIEEGSSILADPSRLFNADESGFPLSVKTTKVLAPKGAKHVYNVCTSDKSQITVMICMNAAGLFPPPFILYPGQRIRNVNTDLFPEARYATTPSGWMTAESFLLFRELLVKFAKDNMVQFPIILFVDSHSSHINFEASAYCRENNVVLYCLLANATHILQPCDVGLFGPMKASWKREVQNWQNTHTGQSLTKRDFPGVFKTAFQNVTEISLVNNAFRRCGLLPLFCHRRG